MTDPRRWTSSDASPAAGALRGRSRPPRLAYTGPAHALAGHTPAARAYRAPMAPAVHTNTHPGARCPRRQAVQGSQCRAPLGPAWVHKRGGGVDGSSNNKRLVKTNHIFENQSNLENENIVGGKAARGV